MSPTTIFTRWDTGYGILTTGMVREGVYPGYGTGWVPGRAIPGTHQDTLPGPYLVYFLR